MHALADVGEDCDAVEGETRNVELEGNADKRGHGIVEEDLRREGSACALGGSSSKCRAGEVWNVFIRVPVGYGFLHSQPDVTCIGHACDNLEIFWLNRWP